MHLQHQALPGDDWPGDCPAIYPVSCSMWENGMGGHLYSGLGLNLPMSLRKIPGPVEIVERINVQPVSMNVKHLHGLTLGDQMI
jgi:hypothetical protein